MLVSHKMPQLVMTVVQVVVVRVVVHQLLVLVVMGLWAREMMVLHEQAVHTTVGGEVELVQPLQVLPVVMVFNIQFQGQLLTLQAVVEEVHTARILLVMAVRAAAVMVLTKVKTAVMDMMVQMD